MDELLLRLLRKGVRDRCGNYHFLNIIRLGKTGEGADEKVNATTLEYQVEVLIQQDPKYKELLKITNSLREVKQQLDDGRDGVENVQHIKYQLSTLRRTKALLEADLDRVKVTIGRKLLTAADVVVSTLSSAGTQTLVGHLVENRVRFDTVIVDEAAQTTEPSVLIPLRYGCSQLVLVGDPRQVLYFSLFLIRFALCPLLNCLSPAVARVLLTFTTLLSCRPLCSPTKRLERGYPCHCLNVSSAPVMRCLCSPCNTACTPRYDHFLLNTFTIISSRMGRDISPWWCARKGETSR